MADGNKRHRGGGLWRRQVTDSERSTEGSSRSRETAAHSPESPLPSGPWHTSNPYSSVVRQSPHGWILPSTTPSRVALYEVVCVDASQYVTLE
jgi:hypothetical protein